MIILEGLLMSGISGIIGGTVGILASFYLSVHYIDLSMFFSPISYAGSTFQPRIRCYPVLDNMVFPIIMIIFLGMIIALFPARKLKRLHPLEVLREV